MLKKKYRLNVGLRRVPASSHKSQTLRLLITKNNLPYNRFGFVISKRIDKRASVRNRIKRVIRSCIEELQDKITKGYDMLFIIQKKALGEDRNTYLNEIKKLLSDI